MSASEPRVRWPSRYDPSVTPIHVRNELHMDAGPELVWAWLVRAGLWPSWYPNSADVEILDGTGPDLFAAARFRWKTFGVRLVSTVREFVPRERIAWDAIGTGVDAYHAWVLTPHGSGTHVLTEETQYGWLARAGDLFMPKRLQTHHQIWLERLRDRARSGLPPPSSSRPR